MPIPCPHFKITIVKRSQGQSAVAGAAYQSGERLFSEYDQKTKFYNKKKELVHAEIMLPSHAPPGFADRATLWNAVEAVENQWNSQLARRIVLAFPVKVPKEQYLSMIKEFCQEQFVSKGKPPLYPYTPIKSSFEDAGSVEDMMLYTELEAAVHAMIQRLEYSFTFNPSLLTSPKRKQQVAEILKEAETYIWRIKEEMRCA